MDTLSFSELVNLAVVVLFGAGGLFLLLPGSTGRMNPRLVHRVGLGLVVVSIVALSLFWKTPKVELISKIFFYLFSFATVVAAVLTITSRDPVRSALWFAAVVLSTSGLFLLSGAQFLAAGTVIVYAGAIIVTFLFVIMLAQKEGRAIYDRVSRAPLVATMASFLLLAALMYPILLLQPREPENGTLKAVGKSSTGRLVSISDRLETSDQSEIFKQTLPRHRLVIDRSMNSRTMLPEVNASPVKPPHVASLGTALFTDHLLTIEIAGSLLFVALIGALVIASPKPPIRPKTTVGPDPAQSRALARESASH